MSRRLLLASRSTLVALALLALLAGTLVGVCAASAAPLRRHHGPSLYPSPVAPSGKVAGIPFPPNGQFKCPNPTGLRSVAVAPRPAVIAALNGLLHAPTEPSAETFADKAGWPIVASMFVPGSGILKAKLGGQDVRVTRAVSSTYAHAYEQACGVPLLRASVQVIWCVGPHGRPRTVKVCLKRQPDLTAYSFFLDRRGHWLFWGFQGGL